MSLPNINDLDLAFDNKAPERTLDDHKRELKLKNLHMKNVIDKIETVITDKEKQRNFKLNSKIKYLLLKLTNHTR